MLVAPRVAVMTSVKNAAVRSAGFSDVSCKRDFPSVSERTGMIAVHEVIGLFNAMPGAGKASVRAGEATSLLK